MTPQQPTEIESRLRTAFADTAATIPADGLSPHPPARPASGRRHSGRGNVMPFVPLGAAAAVAAIAIAAVVVPTALRLAAGRSATTSGPSDGTPPRFMMTVAPYANSLDARNAVTGSVSGMATRMVWYSVAAQGPRTFVAGAVYLCPGRICTKLYRIALNNDGQVASSRPIGKPIPGATMSAAITPDGRYLGYVESALEGNSFPGRLVIRNLVTDKVAASWPIPANTEVSGLSIDAAGNSLAVSAYYYSPEGRRTHNVTDTARLVQWTSVLRIASSGTPIDKLPRIESQSSSLALSPDGKTLYEFLQTGTVTPHSWTSSKPVTFDLVAVDAGTGKVITVFHAWRAVWGKFVPQLSLAPGGRYLLIADGSSLARVDVATGKFTSLPAKIPRLDLYGNDPTVQVVFDPFAW